MEKKKEPIDSKYEIGEDLGKGQFATVKRCIHKETRQNYAAKFIRKRRGGRRGANLQDIEKEIQILSETSHRNIINLYEVYDTNREVILILELVDGGELFEYLSLKDKLSEEEASAFIKQILDGVQHLHSKYIAHLDLKPENILLQDKNSTAVKLIDFGLSRKIHPKEDQRAMLGTAEFVAPEVVSFEPLSIQTDMWSIGVLTYILLSGVSPFLGEDQQDTYHNITSINYDFDEEFFDGTSELAKDFIRKLLVKDQRKRATIDFCLNHPWIKPVEKKQRDLRRSSIINTEHLKKFMARQRWKRSMKVVSLCNRLSRSLQLARIQSTDTLGSGAEETARVTNRREDTSTPVKESATVEDVDPVHFSEESIEEMTDLADKIVQQVVTGMFSSAHRGDNVHVLSQQETRVAEMCQTETRSIAEKLVSDLTAGNVKIEVSPPADEEAETSDRAEGQNTGSLIDTDDNVTENVEARITQSENLLGKMISDIINSEYNLKDKVRGLKLSDTLREDSQEDYEDENVFDEVKETTQHFDHDFNIVSVGKDISYDLKGDEVPGNSTENRLDEHVTCTGEMNDQGTEELNDDAFFQFPSTCLNKEERLSEGMPNAIIEIEVEIEKKDQGSVFQNQSIKPLPSESPLTEASQSKCLSEGADLELKSSDAKNIISEKPTMHDEPVCSEHLSHEDDPPTDVDDTLLHVLDGQTSNVEEVNVFSQDDQVVEEAVKQLVESIVKNSIEMLQQDIDLSDRGASVEELTEVGDAGINGTTCNKDKLNANEVASKTVEEVSETSCCVDLGELSSLSNPIRTNIVPFENAQDSASIDTVNDAYKDNVHDRLIGTCTVEDALVQGASVPFTSEVQCKTFENDTSLSDFLKYVEETLENNSDFLEHDEECDANEPDRDESLYKQEMETEMETVAACIIKNVVQRSIEIVHEENISGNAHDQSKECAKQFKQFDPLHIACFDGVDSYSNEGHTVMECNRAVEGTDDEWEDFEQQEEGEKKKLSERKVHLTSRRGSKTLRGPRRISHGRTRVYGRKLSGGVRKRVQIQPHIQPLIQRVWSWEVDENIAAPNRETFEMSVFGLDQ